MSNGTYQSSQQYLALPDILKTSFRFNGSLQNVRQAEAADFHAFISQYVEEFENVDTEKWTSFHRWRVINMCLEADVLTLAEVPDGYTLAETRIPEVEIEKQAEAAPEPVEAIPVGEQSS